jgi:hypothetical protein
MNKIVHIKIFNDILDQFFNFLEKSFVDSRSDLILTRNTIEFLRKNNPRLVVEEFMNYIKPFEKQIINCDEDFFINFEQNLPGSTSSKENLLLGSRLKLIWLSIGPQDDIKKASVFYYFQKLIKSGDQCMI